MTHDRELHTQVPLDGTVYDFSKFDRCATAAKLCAATLYEHRSKGETVEARRKTNKTFASRLRVFLKFAQSHGIDRIDEMVCRDYIEHLRAKYHPTSEWAMYLAFSKVVALGLKKQVIPDFTIPRAIGKAKADASRGDTKTLADLYVAELDSRTHGETNRMLLRLLEEFCWRRVHTIRDRQRQGFIWREEAILKKNIKLFDGVVRSTREEHLKHIVQYCWKAADGHTGYHSRKISANYTYSNVCRYLDANNFDICWAEIREHLRVMSFMQGPFMALYAMERMNPTMVLRLEHGMLQHDPINTGKMRVIITKGRANKEYVFGPFKVGNDAHRSIAQALLVQREMAERCFDSSPISPSERIFKVFLVGRTGITASCITCAHNSMKALQDSIHKNVDDEFAPLRNLNGRISLEMIRTTVINVDRRSSSFQQTSKLARHKSPATIALYLNNRGMRSVYKDEIEAGQKLLVGLVKTAKLIYPDGDPEKIAKENNLSKAGAKQLLDDDRNLGFGISLIDERAFVVCTALNCLRISTWIDALEGARARITCDNPDRWDRIWEPQLALFRQALADFPRKIVAEARRLKNEVSVVYPEPY